MGDFMDDEKLKEKELRARTSYLLELTQDNDEDQQQASGTAFTEDDFNMSPRNTQQQQQQQQHHHVAPLPSATIPATRRQQGRSRRSAAGVVVASRTTPAGTIASSATQDHHHHHHPQQQSKVPPAVPEIYTSQTPPSNFISSHTNLGSNNKIDLHHPYHGLNHNVINYSDQPYNTNQSDNTSNYHFHDNYKTNNNNINNTNNNPGGSEELRIIQSRQSLQTRAQAILNMTQVSDLAAGHDDDDDDDDDYYGEGYDMEEDRNHHQVSTQSPQLPSPSSSLKRSSLKTSSYYVSPDHGTASTSTANSTMTNPPTTTSQEAIYRSPTARSSTYSISTGHTNSNDKSVISYTVLQSNGIIDREENENEQVGDDYYHDSDHHNNDDNKNNNGYNYDVALGDVERKISHQQNHHSNTKQIARHTNTPVTASTQVDSNFDLPPNKYHEQHKTTTSEEQLHKQRESFVLDITEIEAARSAAFAAEGVSCENNDKYSDSHTMHNSTNSNNEYNARHEEPGFAVASTTKQQDTYTLQLATSVESSSDESDYGASGTRIQLASHSADLGNIHLGKANPSKDLVQGSAIGAAPTSIPNQSTTRTSTSAASVPPSRPPVAAGAVSIQGRAGYQRTKGRLTVHPTDNRHQDSLRDSILNASSNPLPEHRPQSGRTLDSATSEELSTSVPNEPLAVRQQRAPPPPLSPPSPLPTSSIQIQGATQNQTQTPPMEDAPRPLCDSNEAVPNVMNEEKEKTQKASRFKVLLFLIVVLIFAGIVVGVVLALGGKDDDQNPEDDMESSTVAEQLAALRQIIEKFSSDPTVLDYDGNDGSTKSSQRNALEWLLTSTATEGLSPENDISTIQTRYGLAVLYYSTSGPGAWKNKFDFLTPESVCQWSDLELGMGVLCNDNGEVVEIRLPNNSLIGYIPEELSALPILEVIDFSINSLSQSIPITFQNLVELYLANNLLTGFPNDFGLMTNLVVLDVARNDFSSTLPESVGDLVYLKTLAVNENNFIGAVPDSIRNLSVLQTLNLAENDFSGSLDFIASLSTLEVLHLEENGFTGNLPPGIEALSNLVVLDIAGNNIGGNIPTEIGNLTSLQSFQADDNMFVGMFPWSSFVGNSNLTLIAIRQNELSGSLPDDFSSFPYLEEIAFRANAITGSIPAAIEQLSSLIVMDLQNNKISGSLPVTLGNFSNLENILLTTNEITGTLPSSLGNLFSLLNLQIGINDLRGTIPESIGNLSNLQTLILMQNELTGPIPTSFGNLIEMTQLRLNFNFLRGMIPQELSNLVNLKALFLDGNSLTGSVQFVCSLDAMPSTVVRCSLVDCDCCCL